MDKPVHVFDRTDEWSELERFSRARPATQSLGLVHGRRRQGKSYLLEAFVEAHGGFYFTSLQQSSAQNLERLSSAYAAHARVGVPVRFSTWEQALTAVLALGEREETVVPVVIDEFPYLLADSPELPSLIQSLLRSRIAPRETGRAALILCGSALSTMRGLLAGTAALRGRASLEMLVHPFSFRDAARFWGVDADPDLSVRLHALLGGTPAYRDMCGGAIPTDAGFDQWVISTLLNPASAMQREGDILLAEENQISDLAPYYAVLAAISNGRTRRGEIASTLGRSTGALSHPLAVLVETGLVSVEEDALRDKRATFHIAEPILRFHQLIIDPNRGPLSRRRPGVWLAVTDTVSSQIYGPHFQHLSARGVPSMRRSTRWAVYPAGWPAPWSPALTIGEAMKSTSWSSSAVRTCRTPSSRSGRPSGTMLPSR